MHVLHKNVKITGIVLIESFHKDRTLAIISISLFTRNKTILIESFTGPGPLILILTLEMDVPRSTPSCSQ